MKSRMERYYKLENSGPTNTRATNKRSVKNRRLYDNIYEDVEYSNIEGVADLDIKNEVDIEKIKNLLKSREDINEDRKRDLVKKREERALNNNIEDERTYDIMDVLSKAKEGREDEPAVKKTLRNTHYDMLEKAELERELKNREKQEKQEANKDDIGELVDTITNSKLLDELADKDLSLDVLDDLKGDEDGTITTENTSIRRLIDAEKKTEDHHHESHHENKPENIDKSFYTSGISFDKEDFEQALDEEVTEGKEKIILKIFLFVFFVLLAIASAVGLYVFLT